MRRKTRVPPHIFQIQHPQEIKATAFRRGTLMRHVGLFFRSPGRLSDGLVCSNGIISSKLAGKLRYLDST